MVIFTIMINVIRDPLKILTSFAARNAIRLICTTGKRSVLYKEIENDHAHRVLEDIACYSQTVVKSSKLIETQRKPNVDSNSIYGAFYNATLQNLEGGLNLEKPQLTNLLHTVTKRCHSASYAEVIHMLHCLTLWPFPLTRRGGICYSVCKTLDNVCTYRLNHWTTAEKLLVADYWFHLRLSSFMQYNMAMIKNLVAKKEVLDPKEIVQLFFFIGVQRNVPKILLTRLEGRVKAILPTISNEELNVVCLGFFKNEIEIQDHNLLKTILAQIATNMKEIDSVNLVGILKCLRKSFKPHIVGYYQKFIKSCADSCSNWNIYALIHAALLSSSCFIYQPSLLITVIERFEKQLCEVRLKDICKLLQCLSLFNHLPDSSFNEKLFFEFQSEARQDEISHHPRHVVQFAVFYSYMGKYNYDILEKAMDAEMISKFPDHEKRLFTFLDYCIDIECEDYVGPRMNLNLRNRLTPLLQSADEYSLESKFTGILTKATENVKKILDELFGFAHDTCVKQVLPHMVNPDIILRLNPKPDALPLRDVLKSHSQYQVLRPPPDETWACIILGGHYSFAYNSDRICGLMAMKQRQLTKLGYKVLLLNAIKLTSNAAQREALLKVKLNELQQTLAKQTHHEEST